MKKVLKRRTMKTTLITLMIMLSVSANAKSEEILAGSRTEYAECSMGNGYAVDSDKLTQIQSSDVFFRIKPGNGTFFPQIVITNTDEKGRAHSNPISFGVQGCLLMKRCIDQFASKKVSVAASCDEGILNVVFIKN